MTEAEAGSPSGAAPEDKEPPSRAGARRSFAGAPVAWTIAVVLIAVAAAYVTLPIWRDHLPAPVRDRLAGRQADDVVRFQAALEETRASSTTAISELEKSNAALRQQVQRLEARIAEADQRTARLSAIEQALAKLEASQAQAAGAAAGSTADRKALLDRIAELESAVKKDAEQRDAAEAQVSEIRRQRDEAATEFAAQAAALNDRITKLEARLTSARQALSAADKSDSLALAAGQLRDALSRGVPFAAELATLRSVAAGDPDVSTAVATAIAPIVSEAEAGIPSRAALFSRLPSTIDAAWALGQEPAAGGWVDRTVSKLRGLIRVRRVDGRGSGSDAALARAEIAAGRGDLGPTVEALSGLEAPASTAVGPWLRAARSRLAADQANADLNRIVMSGFAAGG